MEACGGSQHWARTLTGMGHEVKLMPAKAVKPFVGGNKNDVHDARAIWTAVQQPGVKHVVIKSEEQQAILALHRMRQQLVKFRTAQINGLRGLLTEYGEVMPKGKSSLTQGIAEALARLSDRLPSMVIDTLREQWTRIGAMDAQIAEIERRLKIWLKEDRASQRIADIPGIGLLTATAAVATMGDPKGFKSGREFAAWLGLVPRQRGTGGRTQLLGISKRGDTYLRTLLIHGARTVLLRAKEQSPWMTKLRSHRRTALHCLVTRLAAGPRKHAGVRNLNLPRFSHDQASHHGDYRDLHHPLGSRQPDVDFVDTHDPFPVWRILAQFEPDTQTVGEKKA